MSECHFTNELIHSLKYLLDSSIEVVISHPSSWESSESFKNLLLEPKKLWIYTDNRYNNFLDDEFFRCAGRVLLAVKYIQTSVPVSDSQLKLLFGRNDLSEICIDFISGITAEGLRQAMQALLFASPKKITLVMHSEFADLSVLSKRLGSESVLAELVEKEGKRTNCFKYSCGDRRATVHIKSYFNYYDERRTAIDIDCY